MYQPAAKAAGGTGDPRVYRLRGSFGSLLLWEGRSLTAAAEQAGTGTDPTPPTGESPAKQSGDRDRIAGCRVPVRQSRAAHPPTLAADPGAVASGGTVKVHLSHIFAKLGITTRSELATEVRARVLRAVKRFTVGPQSA